MITTTFLGILQINDVETFVYILHSRAKKNQSINKIKTNKTLNPKEGKAKRPEVKYYLFKLTFNEMASSPT